MTRTNPTPATDTDAIFLTEGGTETEIMYRHGFELPEFALFPLLETVAAICDTVPMDPTEIAAL